MVSNKPKQFTRPPKKAKPKAGAAAPETADEYQEAADHEEAAGGKHRVGDPVKSARAFLRALDLYDRGVSQHTRNFDLAYNRARLQLELSQQPALVEHIGVDLVEWLQNTLTAHRHALRLREDNADVLFNTAQVLSSLAEQLLEADREAEAVSLLQESLELLSSCLATQELQYAQHRRDFADVGDDDAAIAPEQEAGDEGGVRLDVSVDQGDQATPSTSTAPADTDMTEQSAMVETPVGPADLLDTVHASLATLTTLVALTEASALQNIGNIAQQITDEKAPSFIDMLPPSSQELARFALAVARSVFVASFANRQFEQQLIDLAVYRERLVVFDSLLPAISTCATALYVEAEARTEFVLAALDQLSIVGSSDLRNICWQQLGLAQDLYSQANTQLQQAQTSQKSGSNDTDGPDPLSAAGRFPEHSRAEVYKSKGDVELLRYRVATLLASATNAASPSSSNVDSLLRSAPTLLRNAQTFYKGAAQLAQVEDDDVALAAQAQQRLLIAQLLAARDGNTSAPSTQLQPQALEDCVNEGWLAIDVAQAIGASI